MSETVSERLPKLPEPDVREEQPAGQSDLVVKRREKIRSRIVQAAGLLGLAIVLLLLWHFIGSKSDNAANRPRSEVVPVEMAAATQMDVPVQIKSIGNIEALSTIAVRSQVTGTLQNVHFTPGQEVQKGALLFTIDPRPLQAALGQAEANLLKAMAAVKQGQDIVNKDEATANNARITVKRDLELLEAGVVPRQQYDNDLAIEQAAEATVRADQSSVANLQAAVKAEQANVQNATVQLSYTSIRAPIAGKTGNLAITAGNLISANDSTPLVTITQASPIYVTFAVPEQDLLRIRQYASSTDFKTEVVIPGDEANPAQGKLSLVDNTVDTSTGTIRLKATFDNAERKLFPGLFANVVLTLGQQREAVVVPSQAVQIGQDSSFVYVVKPDMTVEVRNVKTGTNVSNMTVIEEGIKPGERVVTDGQLRLVPGATVQQKSGQQGGGSGTRRGGNTNPAAGAGPGSGANPTAGATPGAGSNAGAGNAAGSQGYGGAGKRGP
jgi:membrane fusion protein, multidrug efflux system